MTETEYRKRKIRRAKLGAYVEKTLGNDVTPENFFGKVQRWVEEQEHLKTARVRAIEKILKEEYYTPPPLQFKNPLSKYEFDEGY